MTLAHHAHTAHHGTLQGDLTHRSSRTTQEGAGSQAPNPPSTHQQASGATTKAQGRKRKAPEKLTTAPKESTEKENLPLEEALISTSADPTINLGDTYSHPIYTYEVRITHDDRTQHT